MEYSDEWVDVPLDNAKDEWVDVDVNAPAKYPSFYDKAMSTGKDFADATVESLPMLGGMVGGTLGAVGVGPLGAVSGAGVGGYLGESAKNLINSYRGSEEAPQDASEYLTRPIEQGANAISAEVLGQKVINPAIENIPKGLSYVGDKLGSVGKTIAQKMGKVLGNIPEETVGTYIDRGGQIAARPADEIMEDIYQIRQTREQALEKAKEGVSASKENLSKAQQRARDQIADESFALKSDHEKANLDYDRAARGIEKALKGKNVSGLRTDIIDAIGKLKDNVTVGSSQAYEVLGDLDGSIRIKPVLDMINKEVDNLTIRGTPVSDSAVSSIKNLNAFYERLSQMGDEISFPEAKGIMQQLDRDINYPVAAGQYFPEAQAVKSQVRRAMDKILKSKSTEYKAVMKGVAEDTNLLSKLSEQFGTESRALSKLQSLASEKGKLIDVPMLKKLGEKTGYDFAKPIEEYLTVQNAISGKDGLKALQENTPEFKRLKAIQDKIKQRMNPELRRSIEQGIEQGPEGQALSNAQGALEQAKQEFEPLAEFAPGSIQAKTKALTGARNFNPEKLFKALDEATGKEFSKEIKDRAILDAFTKQDTNGARKTLLGKAIGAGIGGGIGYDQGGGAGAAAGAMLGASMDKYSGQILKGLIDGSMSVNAAIKSLGPRYGKYAKPLVESARMGPVAMDVMFSLLSKDPEFRKKMEQ